MTGTAIDPVSEVTSRASRAWALDQLGLKDVPTPEELRDYCLALLARESFLSTPDKRLAIDILLRASRSELAEVRQFQDHFLALGQQVEQFATQYWHLEPGDRRHRWEQLHKKLDGMPLLQNRLDSLNAGLDIDDNVMHQADPPTQSIIKTIKAGFVLEPMQQARFYQNNLCSIENPQGWITVLKRFQAKYPQIARLAPDFIANASFILKRSKVNMPGQFRSQPLTPGVPVTQNPTGTQINWWTILVIIGIIGGIARGILKDTNSTTIKPSRPTTPLTNNPMVVGIDPIRDPIGWELKWNQLNPNPTQQQLQIFEKQKQFYQAMKNGNSNNTKPAKPPISLPGPSINNPLTGLNPMSPVDDLEGWERLWKKLNPNPTPQQVQIFERQKQFFETLRKERLNSSGLGKQPK